MRANLPRRADTQPPRRSSTFHSCRCSHPGHTERTWHETKQQIRDPHVGVNAQHTVLSIVPRYNVYKPIVPAFIIVGAFVGHAVAG